MRLDDSSITTSFFDNAEYIPYQFLSGQTEKMPGVFNGVGVGNISLRFLAIAGLLACKARSCGVIESAGFNLIIGFLSFDKSSQKMYVKGKFCLGTSG